MLEVARRVQMRDLPPPSDQRAKLAQHRVLLDEWLDRDRPLKLTKIRAL